VDTTGRTRKDDRASADGIGTLFIFSAPSGTGKTTLCRAVLKRCAWLQYSISFTTRSPRDNELDGIDYYFIEKKEFIKGIENGEWVEWAKVHDHYYGTSAKHIDINLSLGKDTLLDIDVQGTFQILKKYPDSIAIFIMPPSIDVLRTRLESRGTDSRKNIEKRLANAEQEMACKDQYHYVVVNDQLKDAVDALTAIIQKHSTKPGRK